MRNIYTLFRFEPLSLVLSVTLLFANLTVCGQKGKDGDAILNNANFTVNEYTTLSGNATAGASFIRVGNNALNSFNRFSAVLGQGDLILIIQMQGATINSSNTASYGTVLTYNNCGLHELAQVDRIGGSDSIYLSCPLQNNYTAAGRVQVIRVPRYRSLQVNASATILAPGWNGSLGGIVAIECDSAATLNGLINVSGRGFRGGARSNAGSVNLFYGGYRSTTLSNGGIKGEGIAGNANDYNSFMGGRYGKGSPANGGGGGNAHNCGGGGGSNGGIQINWNGLGNPDNSLTGWTTAWNLEGANFSATTSSGGGRGGYSYSSANANATVSGPGNGAWGGANRRNDGGVGGRPLDYSTGRVFMGGGGGAGDENNNAGGGGGNGGGMVFFWGNGATGGSGEIRANGNNGANTRGGGNDGPGGGGAGGTILMYTTQAVTGITLNASGGRGGSQFINSNEAEGPGGGGSGGYIAVANGTPTRNAAGGRNGTTNSPSLTEFLPNGATSGGVGTASASVNAYSVTVGPGDTLCPGDSTTLTASLTGTAPAGAVLTWYDDLSGGNVLGTGTSFQTGPISTTTTFYVGICPGWYRVPVTVEVRGIQTFTFTGPTVVCNNTNGSAYALVLSNPSAYSYSWSVTGGTIASGGGNSTSATVNWGNAGTGNIQVTVTGATICDTTLSQTVTIQPDTMPVIFGPDTVCNFSIANNYSVGSVAGASYSWGVTGGSLTAGNGTNAVSVTWAAPGSGRIFMTLTTSGGCVSTDTVPVTILPSPTPVITGPDTACSNSAGHIYSTPNVSGNSYVWTVTGGTILNGSGTNSVEVQWGGAGIGTIQVREINAAGCFTNFSYTVLIFSNPSPVLVGGQVCEYTSGVGYSTPFAAGNQYTWTVTGGTIASGAGTNAITVNWGASGTGTIRIVESNVAGCTERDSVSISILPKPDPQISGPDSVCANGFHHYWTSPNTGNTYNWVITGGNLTSGAGTDTISVLWGAAGVGTVQVTETTPAGCDTTVVYNVVINPNPAPVISGPARVCGGDGALTYSTPNNAGSAYVWTITGGTITSGSGTNSIQVTWGNLGSGLLTVTETNVFGCTGNASYQVRIDPAPEPVISGPDPVCEFTDGYLYTTPARAGNLYSWTVTGGSITNGQGTNTVTVRWGPAGTGTLELFELTAQGCDSTVQLSVQIVPRPEPAITGPVELCEFSNGTAYFAATQAGASYTWSVTGGTITSGNGTSSVVVDWGGAGTGTVTLTMTNSFGCDSTLSQPVTLFPEPEPTISGPTDFCLDDFLRTYTVNAGAGSTVSWQLSGAGVIVSGAGTNSIQVLWGQAGAGTLTVTETSAQGCVGSTSFRVRVFDLPVAVLDPVQASGCVPLDQLFQMNTSGGGLSYSWDFGDGGTGSSRNVVHTYSSPGTYTVTGIVTNANGCRDTVTGTVTVFAPPVAGFTVNGSLPPLEIFIPDGQAGFQNLSQGGTSWAWTFGDGQRSEAFEPTIRYQEPGTYPVVLLVTDDATGCTDQVEGEVVVTANYRLFVPNGFSPNGDDLNDQFYVVSENVVEFNIRIWDRWGKMIYESSDVNFRWDGSFQGNTVPEGAYVWKIIGQDRNGNKVDVSGSLTVLR